MDPEQVRPKKFDVKDVVYTSDDGFFSIAIGVGDGGNIYDENRMRFAMRWNGKTDDQKGFPTSNGHPMWFQLPNELNDILRVLIENSKDIQVNDKSVK